MSLGCSTVALPSDTILVLDLDESLEMERGGWEEHGDPSPPRFSVRESQVGVTRNLTRDEMS